MIEIKYSDLRQAFTNRSTELIWYLDLKTGRMTLYSEDVDLGGSDAFAEQLSIDPDRYLKVDPIPVESRYRFMVDFIDEVKQSRARVDIAQAITQKRPFKLFAHTLDTYPEIKTQWQRYEAVRSGQYLVDLLQKEHGIESKINH